MTETTKATAVPYQVKKGDHFLAMGADVEVRRVSTEWADIKVTQPTGGTWTKRQPLPFPDNWKLQPPQRGAAWEPNWTIHPGVHWRDIVADSDLTQTEIAKQMGVSEKHMSQIMTCTVMPGLEATIAFARVTETPAHLLWRLACDHRLALAMGKTDLTSDYL